MVGMGRSEAYVMVSRFQIGGACHQLDDPAAIGASALAART